MTRTLSALVLAAGLAATPALAFDIEAMSDAERATFRDEVRAYLLENPEVIMEAVAVLERRQAAEEVANDAALIATNRDAEAAALLGPVFERGPQWRELLRRLDMPGAAELREAVERGS